MPNSEAAAAPIFSLEEVLPRRKIRAKPSDGRITRRLIWVYFALLFLEGILRKWIVPGLSAPLAVIRDPVLLLIYIYAIRERKLTMHPFLMFGAILGALTFVVGLMGEWGTFEVSAYGLRTNFFHLPLAFVMASVLSSSDLEKIGKWCLILLVPIALLMAYQFRCPPDAWINTTSGGEGVQIAGGSDSIRPPGVFTFITGVAEFFGIAAAFLVYGAVRASVYPKTLVISAAFALVIGLAVSISRLNLVAVGLVVLMLFVCGALQPVVAPRVFPFAILGLLAFGALSQTAPIQKALDAFNERIDNASESEGGGTGFVHRITGVFVMAEEQMWLTPIFGYGLGVGTNAGAKLMTGENAYLLQEDEWPRIIMESGPIFGALYLVWRVSLVLYLGWNALILAMRAQILPMLLFGSCAPLLMIGQFGRPTSLGFAAFSAGLCLTSIRNYQNRHIRGKAILPKISRA